MIYSFTVRGEPVGKGRPKFARRGNLVHAYTPEKTADYEAKVRAAVIDRLAVMSCTDGRWPTDKPVALTIEIIRAIPQSWPKKKKAEALIQPCPTKPDLDNFCKAIMDALNGLAYVDDSQVVKLTAAKRYGVEPMAVVFIEIIQ